MDFYSMISGYIDVGAVALAVLMTQIIKYILPAPKGGEPMDVGPIANKFLPFIPLLVGAAVVIIKDGLISPTIKIDEAVVKGLVSGGIGAYLYRAGKVTFFSREDREQQRREIVRSDKDDKDKAAEEKKEDKK